MAPLRQLANASVAALLRVPPVRRKVMHHLFQSHYDEFAFSLSLGHGLSVPIHHADATVSLSQMFFEGEYEPVFAHLPLPARWLDLGCHMGYFTLYVAWLRAKQGLPADFAALMLDADSRVEPAIRTLIRLNGFEGRTTFLRGLIAEGDGPRGFSEQAYMTSTMTDLGPGEAVDPATVKQVPTIGPARLLAALPPPYDLIKIDVEGGEYDFLTAYGEVLAPAKALVVEWHSWHRGGGGADQIRALAEGHGFRFVRAIAGPVEVGTGGRRDQVGVYLFDRPDPTP